MLGLILHSLVLLVSWTLLVMRFRTYTSDCLVRGFCAHLMSARTVVSTLRGAGIRIFMVTGDFALTAQAIAAECGIITNPPNMVKGISALSRDDAFSTSDSIDENREKAADVSGHSHTCRSIVLSGPELITLNENQWEQLCKYDEIVFARTTPEQKASYYSLLKSSSLTQITAPHRPRIPRPR